jgi:hypothetical protein
VNERIRAELRARGADVDAFYFCPHHPDHGPPCDCRKPQPGLLQRAAREHDLDLSNSITVGDSTRDLEAGRRAGTAARAYAPLASRREAESGKSNDDWAPRIGPDRDRGTPARGASDRSDPCSSPLAPGAVADDIETHSASAPSAYDDWMLLARDLLRAAWERAAKQP